jgi:hypothetical protein
MSVSRGYPGRLVYTVNLGAEAVAASTAYVLVDLSDTTNYPHTQSNFLNLLGLELSTEKASDGVYDLWCGVIYEVDATNGSALWFDVFHIEASGNATDSTDRFAVSRDYTCGGSNPSGISARVNAAGDGLLWMVGNQEQAGNTNWQTDVGLASPVGAAAGATGKPGAGDIVVWVEEVSGTGTIDFSITAHYESW